MSGLGYDANHPEAQLWIHLTQWHSVLLAYERFGPGKLDADEELQYWAECRRAAELQTIDPDTVPRNRMEMRAYYLRMRPRLAATAVTQDIVGHLLDANLLPEEAMPPLLRSIEPLIRHSLRQATISTLPLWLRRMAGIRQSRSEDALATLRLRAAMRALEAFPDAKLALLERISARTASIVAPALLGIAPTEPVTVTPRIAWQRAGKHTPPEQYAAQLASRATQPAATKAPTDPGAAHLLAFS